MAKHRSENASFFCVFNSKCVFRYGGVQFFRHRNFKKCSVPFNFLTFSYFKMCFSPQRRAMFEHLNFKKWSENISFLAFSLQNVLLATVANISTSKRGLRMLFFLYFYFKMCFSPQWRAIFDFSFYQMIPYPPF